MVFYTSAPSKSIFSSGLNNAILPTPSMYSSYFAAGVSLRSDSESPPPPVFRDTTVAATVLTIDSSGNVVEEVKGIMMHF